MNKLLMTVAVASLVTFAVGCDNNRRSNTESTTIQTEHAGPHGTVESSTTVMESTTVQTPDHGPSDAPPANP